MSRMHKVRIVKKKQENRSSATITDGTLNVTLSKFSSTVILSRRKYWKTTTRN
jgi:hypothetical protein